jgi:hypothetical protein
VEKSGKLLTRKFNVLGNGTLLGTAEVNHGTAEVIENWFRSHPLLARTPPRPQQLFPRPVLLTRSRSSDNCGLRAC